ncbi:MAG TPA: SRPBCC domain-containing protein [Candidatus Acidoferrales bacterium]
MAEAKKITPPVALQLRRTFPFPRERVFAAFSHQEQMDQWMCRDAKQHVIRYVKFDFRVGGGFELEIHVPNGEVYAMDCAYLEIVKPEKIKFSWSYERIAANGKRSDDTLHGTLVTIEFRDRDGATEVVLTHELLPSEQQLKDHQQGWTGCLDKLGELLASA